MIFDVFCFVWITTTVSGLSHGKLEEVDAKSAGNYCEQGLATYNDFKSKLANMGVLKNGQSGWLSGYAQLSQALSVESCFNTTVVSKRNLTVDIRGNILTECTKYCNGNMYPYIGLQKHTCICLKRDDLNLANQKRLSECQKACQTTLDFNCEKYLVIYRKVNTHNSHSDGQCVYIVKREHDKVLYESASCHTLVGLNMQGYICRCEGNCNSNEQPKLSFAVNEPQSWTEAYNSCVSKNSSLISKAYSNGFDSLIPCCNIKYWIGVFRPISPVIYSYSNTCLAVTKVNLNYFVDVDDCSTAKIPICSNRSSYISSTKFLTSTEPSTQSEKHSKGSNKVVFAVGLTLGMLAVIVIIGCVVARCYKSRRASTANRTLLTHANDFTVSGTEDYAITDGDQSALKVECSQIETFVKDNRKNKPIKPERLTLRRQKKAIQAYENFQLVPVEDRKTSKVRSQDDQYDRVDRNRSTRQNNEIVPLEADLHVYNHTLCDDNSYDITLPRQKSRFANEDYDSTQLDNVKLYNTFDMASIGKNTDRLNTPKTVQNSNCVSSAKDDFVYVDDDQIILDDCANSSSLHVYSEMDYDAVDRDTANTQKVEEQSGVVCEVVGPEYKNVDL